MRRLAVFGLLSCISVLPASAQTDTASLRRILALEAKVAALELLTGIQGFHEAPIPCDQMESRRPTWYFPNGEYPMDYRTKQFGCFANDIVNSVAGLQAQMAGSLSRIASIESSVAGGQPVGTAVFDKIRANKVCIGDADCDPDWNADLQIRKNALANIGLEANLAHIDPQDPSHTHVSQFNVSTDGGTRIQQNCKSTYSRGYYCYVNACREALNFGPDSRSSVSIYVASVNDETHPTAPCTPIPHDGAQDFVFKTDENLRRSQIVLTRPNWNFQIIFSSALHSVDKSVDILPPP